MMVKKLMKMVFAGVLALSLTVPSFAAVAPVEGDEIHVISLDEAVKIALSHSSTIGELEDTLDTLEDSREALNNAYMSWAVMQAESPVFISDQYHSFLQSFTELDTGIKNISLYNKLTEEGLRYGLMNLARYIKEIELALAMQEKNFVIARETNIINHTKHRLGMISQNELFKLTAEYEAVKVSLEELKSSREALYTSLYNMLGTGYNKKYVIQFDSLFERLDVSEESLGITIDHTIQQDIYLKILKNAVDDAEYNMHLYSSSGPSYDTKEKNLKAAKRDYKDAKADLEKAARDSYNTIKGYENKQSLLEAELQVAKDTYKAMEINLQNGMITQLQLDQVALAIDSAEYNIVSNMYAHMIETYVFYHPYVAAAGASAGGTN